MLPLSSEMKNGVTYFHSYIQESPLSGCLCKVQYNIT